MRSVLSMAVLLVAAALSGCVKYHPRPLDPPRSEQQFRARTLANPGLQAFLKRTDWPLARLGLNDLTGLPDNIFFRRQSDVFGAISK